MSMITSKKYELDEATMKELTVVKHAKKDNSIEATVTIDIPDLGAAIAFLQKGAEEAKRRAAQEGGTSMQAIDDATTLLVSAFAPWVQTAPDFEEVLSAIFLLLPKIPKARRLQSPACMRAAARRLQAATRRLAAAPVSMYSVVTPKPGSNVKLDQITNLVKSVTKEQLTGSINDVLTKAGLPTVEVAALGAPQVKTLGATTPGATPPGASVAVDAAVQHGSWSLLLLFLLGLLY